MNTPNLCRSALRLLPWLAAGLLCLSCVEGELLQQSLKQSLREAVQPQANSQKVDKQPADPQVAEMDSLLRLVTQDVGIDPDEGTVQRAIWRVRIMKFNLRTARQALDNARNEIFELAATTEEKRALKELDERIETSEGQERDELVAERVRVQDEAIHRAREEGELERKKLSGEQAKRFGLLLYNLGVGVICDNLVIRHGKHVSSDFTRVKHELFDSGGVEAMLAWGSVLQYHEEFLAIPGDMIEIMQEVPLQLTALGNMISTIRVLKKNNEIEEREPEPGDSFESMEDF